MTRYAKVDANHAVIKKAFLDLGCSVADTSRLGGGFGDLVVGVPAGVGVNVLVEVKNPLQPKSKRGPRKGVQERFHQEWRGAPPKVIETVSEAVLLVSQIRAQHGA